MKKKKAIATKTETMIVTPEPRTRARARDSSGPQVKKAKTATKRLKAFGPGKMATNSEVGGLMRDKNGQEFLVGCRRNGTTFDLQVGFDGYSFLRPDKAGVDKLLRQRGVQVMDSAKAVFVKAKVTVRFVASGEHACLLPGAIGYDFHAEGRRTFDIP